MQRSRDHLSSSLIARTSTSYLNGGGLARVGVRLHVQLAVLLPPSHLSLPVREKQHARPCE